MRTLVNIVCIFTLCSICFRISFCQLHPFLPHFPPAITTVNGDGVITCEEFTKVFLNMGFEEREKELKDAIERQKKQDQVRSRSRCLQFVCGHVRCIHS